MNQDAFSQLKNDHAQLIKDMDNIENSYQNKRPELKAHFSSFKNTFKIHDKTEDKVIYPKLLKFKELKKLILKGYQAHHIIEIALLELKLIPFGGKSWLPKFLVVKDSILQHMTEEENVLFPSANNLLSEEEKDDILDAVNQFRNHEG